MKEPCDYITIKLIFWHFYKITNSFTKKHSSFCSKNFITLKGKGSILGMVNTSNCFYVFHFMGLPHITCHAAPNYPREGSAASIINFIALHRTIRVTRVVVVGMQCLNKYTKQILYKSIKLLINCFMRAY